MNELKLGTIVRAKYDLTELGDWVEAGTIGIIFVEAGAYGVDSHAMVEWFGRVVGREGSKEGLFRVSAQGRGMVVSENVDVLWSPS